MCYYPCRNARRAVPFVRRRERSHRRGTPLPRHRWGGERTIRYKAITPNGVCVPLTIDFYKNANKNDIQNINYQFLIINLSSFQPTVSWHTAYCLSRPRKCATIPAATLAGRFRSFVGENVPTAVARLYCSPFPPTAYCLQMFAFYAQAYQFFSWERYQVVHNFISLRHTFISFQFLVGIVIFSNGLTIFGHCTNAVFVASVETEKEGC